jgi:hypothetical protein
VATITNHTDRLHRFYVNIFSIDGDHLIAAGAADHFVTDFGPSRSLFFRDPDETECELLIANHDATSWAFNPPGTPAT